jgi:hypothetical protein
MGVLTLWLSTNVVVARPNFAPASNYHYRKRPRRSMARGAGLLFLDNQNATGYRHLQEGKAER